MKRIIADTNAFLRVLLDDIPTQKKEFEKILQKAKEKHVHLLIPQIVIFEIDFILRKYYKIPKGEVIEKLLTLVQTDYLSIESRDLFIVALTLYRNHSISFVDCFLLAKAKEEEAELFTFDNRLKKL